MSYIWNEEVPITQSFEKKIVEISELSVYFLKILGHPKRQAEEMEENLKAFKNDIPVMQQDVIRWIQGAVIRDFRPDLNEIQDLLRRLLFINIQPGKPIR